MDAAPSLRDVTVAISTLADGCDAVVLPPPAAGLRYLVLDNGEVRLLKSRDVSELAGSLAYDGPAVSVEEMDAAIRAGARNDRG